MSLRFFVLIYAVTWTCFGTIAVLSRSSSLVAVRWRGSTRTLMGRMSDA
jgi:hypothetical protein